MGLVQHILTEEEMGPIRLIDHIFEQDCAILRNLKPNEYIEMDSLPASQTNTQPFNQYIDRLQQAEFDIGKGDAKYGFKMPLPTKEASKRKLIIFRRR